MGETLEQRATAVATAAAAARDLEPHQAELVQGVVPPPGEKTTGVIWIIAVGGLVALLAIALGGLIYLLAEEKTTDLVLTAFTALLTGLIGLFSPSPVKAGSKGG
jgi:hypothetical protein